MAKELELDAPARHGKWIREDNTFTRFKCSACGDKNHKGNEKYCSSCGAKMDWRYIMPRLIDADNLTYHLAVNDEDQQFFYVKSEDIDEQPTVDAVPVVRCKNCEYSDAECHKDNFRYCMRGIKGDDYNETGYIYPLEVIVRDDDFCSYGKRRGIE